MAQKNFLYCEETDTKISPNDVVIIANYPNIKWIAKHGWYKLGTAQKNGWYFISIADKSIISINSISLSDITKDTEQGKSSATEAPSEEIKYIVIPNTNIRLYEGDIVKISGRPRKKFIVHSGWYIYNEVQNYGWYFECTSNGEILPSKIIDLTLCTLITSKTQGSVMEDGKVVNYTKPYTEADAEMLSRTFITVDTIKQRDNLDKRKIINGKLVRVNDVGGATNYYAWNREINDWEEVKFGGGGEGIPELVGTPDSPITLSQLEDGLYRVIGTYKVSPDSEAIDSTIDHLVFKYTEEDLSNIHLITDDEDIIYRIENDEIIAQDKYITEAEAQALIDEALSDYAEPVPDDFIRSLFDEEVVHG